MLACTVASQPPQIPRSQFMSPSQTLPGPGLLIRASLNEEGRLRARYVAGPRVEAQSQPGREEATDILRSSALVLELLCVSACILEVLRELKTDSLERSGRPSRYFIDRVKGISGLDIVAVVRDARAHLQFPDKAEAPSQPPSVRLFARFVRSVLDLCPIADLEGLGTHLAMETWGHRCRRAFEALRAFVIRNDEAEQSRLRIVAREFGEAGLSVDDVGLLLGVPGPDAIALLEAHGYIRPLKDISLTNDERSQHLVKIRDDRLRRKGKPEFSPESARRDVLASERIEGIDARKWVP